MDPASPITLPAVGSCSPHLLDALGVLVATFLRDQQAPPASPTPALEGGSVRGELAALPSVLGEADEARPPTPSAAALPPPALPYPAARLAARRRTRAAHAQRRRRLAAAPQLELCRCGPRGTPRPATARGRHDLGCPAGRSS